MDDSTVLLIENAAEPVFTLDNEKFEGTGGTKGTGCDGAASSGSPAKMDEGTQGTEFDIDSAIDPLHDTGQSQIECLSFDKLDMPCFIVKDDWFDLGGKRKPGVWYCYETESKGDKANRLSLKNKSQLKNLNWKH